MDLVRKVWAEKDGILMVKLIEAFGGLSPFLMTVHYVPLLIAAIVWSFRESGVSTSSAIADLVGIFGLFVAFPLYFVVSDDGAGDFGVAHVFFLYSFFSLGLLPVATIGLHFLAGRQIGRFIRRFRV